MRNHLTSIAPCRPSIHRHPSNIGTTLARVAATPRPKRNLLPKLNTNHCDYTGLSRIVMTNIVYIAYGECLRDIPSGTIMLVVDWSHYLPSALTITRIDLHLLYIFESFGWGDKTSPRHYAVIITFLSDMRSRAI